MKIVINPATNNEYNYTFQQPHQIATAMNCIGYLRCHFGSSGNEFFSSWFTISNALRTELFKKELNEIINYLRSGKCGLLVDQSHMKKFCSAFSEGCFNNGKKEYCFRINTETYSFLLRCNTSICDYNCYCYCYVKRSLDARIKNAENGIRFVDVFYQDLFYINDGDDVEIISMTGNKRVFLCRYIDSYHTLINGKMFHIYEFATKMAKLGNVCRPVKIKK